MKSQPIQPISSLLQCDLPTCTNKTPMSSNSGLPIIVEDSGGMTTEEIEQAEDILLAIQNEAF